MPFASLAYLRVESGFAFPPQPAPFGRCVDDRPPAYLVSPFFLLALHYDCKCPHPFAHTFDEVKISWFKPVSSPGFLLLMGLHNFHRRRIVSDVSDGALISPSPPSRFSSGSGRHEEGDARSENAETVGPSLTLLIEHGKFKRSTTNPPPPFSA